MLDKNLGRKLRVQPLDDEPYSLGEKIILGIGILFVLVSCSCVLQMFLVKLGGG